MEKAQEKAQQRHISNASLVALLGSHDDDHKVDHVDGDPLVPQLAARRVAGARERYNAAVQAERQAWQRYQDARLVSMAEGTEALRRHTAAVHALAAAQAEWHEAEQQRISSGAGFGLDTAASGSLECESATRARGGVPW